MVRHETDRQLQAFQYWVSLGEERSYGQVSRQFKHSVSTITSWAKTFEWESRLASVENKILASPLEQITAVLDGKFNSEDLQISKKQIDALNALTLQFLEDIRKGSVKIRSVRDFEIVVKLTSQLSAIAEDSELLSGALEELNSHKKIKLV